MHHRVKNNSILISVVSHSEFHLRVELYLVCYDRNKVTSNRYDFRLVFMQIQVFWEISWTVCNPNFEEISFSEIPVISS